MLDKHRFTVQLKESVPGLTKGRNNMVIIPARSEAEAKRMVLSRAHRFGVYLDESHVVMARKGNRIA